MTAPAWPAAPPDSSPAPRPAWLRLLLRDVLVWAVLLGLTVGLDGKFQSGHYPWALFGQIVLWLLLPLAAGIYLNHLLLVPRLLDQGRYAAYAGALVGWALLLAGAMKALAPSFFYTRQSLPQLAFSLLVLMLLGMGLLLLWRTVAGRRERLRRQLLEREQQLRLLEAQVNPHFLFNTLNSLYALSLAQSPRTPDMLLALSGLMRYQLESTRRPAVPLAEELDYLRSYADLQALRLGPRCPVTVELPAAEQAAGLSVPPLLFLALVENAFTYGTRRAQGSFVALQLTLTGARLHLRLRNALPPPTDAQGGAGTGLPNTRQRLQLLFPGRHTLHAAATATEFCTDLTLEL